jgi:hypothetical protein
LRWSWIVSLSSGDNASLLISVSIGVQAVADAGDYKYRRRPRHHHNKCNSGFLTDCEWAVAFDAGRMESIHGIDVSWIHNTHNKGEVLLVHVGYVLSAPAGVAGPTSFP